MPCAGAHGIFFAGSHGSGLQIRRSRKKRVVRPENLRNIAREIPSHRNSRGDALMKKKWDKPVATESATPLEVTSYMEAELEDELFSKK